jgi:hypothetical protein
MPDTSRPYPNGSSQSDRLTGWKDIAAHFGRSVRTVERWEAELGMPVHRMATGKGETVYAFASELERWRETLDTSTAGREAEIGAGVTSERVTGPGVSGESAQSGEPAERATVGPGYATSSGAFLPRFARAARHRAGWVTAALFLAAIAGVIAWMGRHVAPADARHQPSDYQVRGSALTVFGPDGATLWTYLFEFPLDRSVYDRYRMRGTPVVLFEDINSDGNKEVLFVSNPAQTSSRGLYCFSSDGRVLFTHTVTRTVQFGRTVYADPWRAAWIYVSDRIGGGKWVWLVSLDLQFSPSVLQRLGADGALEGEYWSDGHITAVVPTVLNGKRVVLVGSTNDEQQGGALAVLDEASPFGSAPAEASSSRCQRGCPEGQPLAFLVFPRLDIAASIASKASVTRAVANAAGSISVTVLQNPGTFVPDADIDAASSYYELDAKFRVKRAWLNERWLYIHRLFEENHDLVKPQTQSIADEGLWPVLRWDRAGFARITAPERDQ